MNLNWKKIFSHILVIMTHWVVTYPLERFFCTSDWSTWFFPYQSDQRAVICLENVRQVNERWGKKKKMDINLLLRQSCTIVAFSLTKFDILYLLVTSYLTLNFLLKVHQNQIIFPMIPKFSYFGEKSILLWRHDHVTPWLLKKASNHLRYLRPCRITIHWENKH